MVSGGASPNGNSDESALDPTRVHTASELAAALKKLRGSRSYRELNRVAGGGPGNPLMLAPSTLSDVFNGKSVPSRHTLGALLKACGVDETGRQPWLAAWERVSTVALPRPAGACRVRDADPRRLGVHASIQVVAGADGLPPYVPRDLDAELRTAVTVASRAGGMVLLNGGSSVGKTRALFETARAVLPEWWLLHPADAADARGFAQTPAPRTVVWLDELQRYLDQPGGLPAGLIRDLLAAGTVVLATLWPHEVATRSAPRVDGEQDRHAEDREVLKLARIIDVPATFSRQERDRAEQLAADRRIRIALQHADPGVTQVLAAGPELIRRWQHAPASQCYGRAVITAALDARRVGAQAPLTVDYLAAAAPAYLTPAQQATATPDWFDKAISYATEPVHGAASCLTPVAAGMGQIAGFITADYLHQSARTIRRTKAVPDPVWQALITHHCPRDSVWIARNAERRGKTDHVIAFYRVAADAGDRSAAMRLAELLAVQGQVQEAIAVLRQRAEADDKYAARRLAELLAEQGQVQELRQRADAGDEYAARRLAELLVGQGQVQEAIAVLRQPADADVKSAAHDLAELLAAQGQVLELRQRADAGDGFAARRLAELLVVQGQVQEAIAVLRQPADAGDQSAAMRLVGLLVGQGQVQELGQRADAGDEYAARRLAELLVGQGQVQEAIAVLRQPADAGVKSAAHDLAELLAAQGQVQEAIAVLRQPADAGDKSAAHHLAELLAEQGQVLELRQRADAGNRSAARRLAGLLVAQGQVQELQQRAEAGDEYAARRLAELLVGQGQVQEAIAVLRQPADAGDGSAAMRLVGLLVAQGQVQELRQRAEAGDEYAARRLAELFVGQGQVQEAIAVLRQRADAGDKYAARRLAELFVGQGQVREAIAVLRQRADAVDASAARRLAELLTAQGQVQELRQRADAGDWFAARRLVDLLAERGRIDDLEDEVRAGTVGAAVRLAQLQESAGIAEAKSST